MSQLKLTSQKGKVLIKAKRIFAVSLIILRSDLSSGHLRRDLSSGLKPLMGYNMVLRAGYNREGMRGKEN